MPKSMTSTRPNRMYAMDCGVISCLYLHCLFLVFHHNKKDQYRYSCCQGEPNGRYDRYIHTNLLDVRIMGSAGVLEGG